MVEAGVRDILIANQVVGPAKIARLLDLLGRADVKCAVDCRAHVQALGAAAAARGLTLPVVIEVNIGMNRAGVEPGEAAVALAREITAQPGLRFAGLMVGRRTWSRSRSRARSGKRWRRRSTS